MADEKREYDEFPNIISKNELCLVNKKERTFTTTTDSTTNNAAYAIFEPWTEGIHQFKIKGIICMGNGTSIGVITKNVKGQPTWLFDEAECGTSYQLYNGMKTENIAIYHFTNGVPQSTEALSSTFNVKMFSANDTMGIKVDFNENIIRFYFNSKHVGKAYKFPQNTTFYPAISYVCNNILFKPDPLVYRLELCTSQHKQLQDDFRIKYNHQINLTQQLQENSTQIINQLQNQVGTLQNEIKTLQNQPPKNDEFRIKYNEQIKLTQELQENSTQIVSQLQNQVKTLQNEIRTLQHREQNNDDCKECKKWRDKYSDLEVKYKQQKNKIQNVKLYKFWDYDDIVDWIVNLKNNKYKQYEKELRINMKNEKLNGEQIAHIDKNDLHRFGVTGFGHKIELMQHVSALIKQNQGNDVNKGHSENEGHTAYM